MPQELLGRPQVEAPHRQIGGEGMPQVVEAEV
jgi:hypothetical protein